MSNLKKFFSFSETISGTTYFLRNLLVSVLAYMIGFGMGIAMVRDDINLMIIFAVLFVPTYWFSMITIYKRFNALYPDKAGVFTVGLLSFQLLTQTISEPYNVVGTVLLAIVTFILIFINSGIDNHKG